MSAKASIHTKEPPHLPGPTQQPFQLYVQQNALPGRTSRWDSTHRKMRPQGPCAKLRASQSGRLPKPLQSKSVVHRGTHSSVAPPPALGS
eukprot:4846256-Pyramimonas_sp.AAC.1